MSYAICKRISIVKNVVRLTAAFNNVWAIDNKGKEYHEFRTYQNEYYTNILKTKGREMCEAHLLLSFYLGNMQRGATPYAKYIQFLGVVKEQPEDITEAYKLYDLDRSEANTDNLAMALYKDFCKYRDDKTKSVIVLTNYNSLLLKLTTNKLKHTYDVKRAKIYTNALDLNKDLAIIKECYKKVTAEKKAI